jgi:hypothetical protein
MAAKRHVAFKVNMIVIFWVLACWLSTHLFFIRLSVVQMPFWNRDGSGSKINDRAEAGSEKKSFQIYITAFFLFSLLFFLYLLVFLSQRGSNEVMPLTGGDMVPLPAVNFVKTIMNPYTDGWRVSWEEFITTYTACKLWQVTNLPFSWEQDDPPPRLPATLRHISSRMCVQGPAEEVGSKACCPFRSLLWRRSFEELFIK